MAQLERLIATLFEKGGSELTLESGMAISLTLNDTARPVTKNPATTEQVLGLIREIAPKAMRAQLDEDGRLAFRHMVDGNAVEVQIDRIGDEVVATIAPAKPRSSVAAMSVPAEALLMDSTSGEGAMRAAVAPMEVRAVGEERIQSLLRQLVESDGSDLHLRVSLPPMFRVHGELTKVGGADALGREDIEQMLLSIMPDRNRNEFAETNDTDFAYEILDLARFRANALRDRMGPAAVFRVIPTEILTAEQLGISPEVQKLCYLTKGLVVVTGPTGSGKSTTLSSMVDLINRTRSDHIITILGFAFSGR